MPPILLVDYQAPAFSIDTVELVFTLTETHTLVQSTLHMRREKNVPLVLNGEHLVLEEVCLEGVPLRADEYQKTDTSLTLENLPEVFTLAIRTRIEPQNNTALSGLYRSNALFCTQCEPEGFRRITYYLDRPDVMAQFTTTIIADPLRYPVLLSNGNCVKRTTRPDGLLEVVWSDPHRKPCYLFALVAGNLARVSDTYQTMAGRKVAIEFYVEAPYVDRCAAAVQALKDSMRWDEETYGLAYDLDIYMVVAVSDFNMGAMENKGLNIFNTKYVLADTTTATDKDFQGVESVIGHEYFHNWTGNRVTCRDWFQLSLKEGLTVFREQQFSQAMGMGDVKRIQDVNILRSRQFIEDAGPLAHPVRPQSYCEINNFYTATIYNKGAEVIRMQHTLFGAAGFRKGIDLYFQRHDGQAVTTDDFIAAMADANPDCTFDIPQFKRWYTQAGTPEVTVTMQHDAITGAVHLTMTQSCPVTPDDTAAKQPFVMPLVTTLLDPSTGMSIQMPEYPTGVLVLSQAQQRFTVGQCIQKPTLAMLGGFSAPIRLHYAHTEIELGLLIAKAPDAFNRWDAAQQWFTQRILHYAQLQHQQEPWTIDGQFFANFKAAMEDSTLDPAFIGQLITLPGLSYLADQLTSVDMDALIIATQAMERALATYLQTSVAQGFARAQAGGEGWTPVAMSLRALKNVCLRLWVLSGDSAALKAAETQYHTAVNMTDKMGALFSVNDSVSRVRTQLLETFYMQGQHDPLLVDKWLTLQAISPRSAALEDIESLLSHRAFDIRNPNKVYALLAAFAGQNMAAFHRKDGKGYTLLATYIGKIDRMNPQVAARLASYFSSWRKLDVNRQAQVQAVLHQIAALPGLSSDVAEVVQKTLG